MRDNTLLIEQHKQLLHVQADAARVNAAGVSGVTRIDELIQAQLVVPLGNGYGDQAPMAAT
jgi:hypothetical protein